MATDTQTQAEDKSFKIGSLSIRNLVKIVKREDLDKKWEAVPNRPNPTPEEEATIRMLDERWGNAKQAKQLRHDIWNASYLQYKSVNYYSQMYGGYPTYWNSWGQGVFIPRTFETVESMKVQMLGTDPDFTLDPVGPSKTGDQNWIQHLTKSEWKRSRSTRPVKATVHDGLVYGIGIVRNEVINDKRDEYAMSWTEDGSIKYTQKTVQKYFGVGAHRVDPYDFYPDPSPEMVTMDDLSNKGGYTFERSVTDAWELRESFRIQKEAGALGVTDNWQYITPGGDITDTKFLRKEVDNLYGARNDQRYPGNLNDLIGNRTSIFGQKQGTTGKDKIEVRDYWENDRHIIEANGLILLDSPNPYPHKLIPYSKWNVVDGNEFFNMGVPEYMRWLQVCENVLYDQGLNNIVMAVHKMFAVNSRYLEDEGELVTRPFGIVHMKQIPGVKLSDAIMPIEYSTEMNSYFTFMQKNTDNIQKVTGTSEFQTGGSIKDANMDTATVANRLAFAGASRISEVSRHIEEDLIGPMVEQYVANIQFYYQNSTAFEDGHLPIKVEKSTGETIWMKFVPKPTGDLDDSDHTKALDDGFAGVISQDAIQNRVTVAVKGGSSLPMDPSKESDNIMRFAEYAQGATVQSQTPGSDPKTGQPIMIPSSTPVFDMKKVGMKVAEEVFKIPDAEEYAYKAPGDDGQGQGSDQVDPNAPASPAAPQAATDPLQAITQPQEAAPVQ